MAHGVAGGVDTFQPVPAVAQGFPVLHQTGGHKVRRHVTHGGIIIKGADDAVWHTLVAEAVGHSGPDAAVKLHQLNAAQNDGKAHVIQRPHIAGVVRVKVGDENVRVLRPEIQTVHARQQHVQAVLAVKAGVDQQVPSAVRGLDHIAVDVLQRVAGQLDGKGVDIIGDVYAHALPQFLCFYFTNHTTTARFVNTIFA